MLVDPETFGEDLDGSGADGRALLLVAARVGGTRLIDNATLEGVTGQLATDEHAAEHAAGGRP